MDIRQLLRRDRDSDSSALDGDLRESPQQGPDGSVERDNNEPIRGLVDLYSPDKTATSHVHDIADILVEMGRVTSQQCKQVRHDQSVKGCDVETALLNIGLSDDDILTAKARLYGLEFQSIDPAIVEKDAFDKLDFDFIMSNGICPVAIEGETLIVATSDPANVFAIESVKKRTLMNISVVVCNAETIAEICKSFGESEEVYDYDVDDIISDMTEVEVVQEEEEISDDLEAMAGQSPVIKFVNYLISNATKEGASDIHIEPKTKVTKVRYRIDGTLFETMQSPLKMHPAVVSRIKIMANLDISERRLPQDGKISVIIGGRGVDLRVSTLPTNRGEKVVIRVLDSKSIMRGLEDLGMETDVMTAFEEQISLPHGILLVTGPTGSGKSTTLYSALGQMNGEKFNISTVEDPVEYELGFCNQVQANERIGLTFASALRSLLRQDPDIIMIGEIRDAETAKIAVQAALTGHLVLSTLHTNDAPSSVTRLVNIGIDAYLIAASLNAVLAQRLVRRICPECKQPGEVPMHLRKYIEIAGFDSQQFFAGAGCDNCRGSGYAGRVGIYELLVIDDQFRSMINRDSSATNMRQVFHQSSAASLFDDGMKKVQQGLTTIEEVLRVTEAYGQDKEDESDENKMQADS